LQFAPELMQVGNKTMYFLNGLIKGGKILYEKEVHIAQCFKK